MVEAKNIALDMEIEPVFSNKRRISRKRHFHVLSGTERESIG